LIINSTFKSLVALWLIAGKLDRLQKPEIGSGNYSNPNDFRISRWRRPPSLILVNMHFNMAVVFYCIFSTFPPNLVTIGPIVMKRQPIFKIQEGGGRHLEFW